MTYYVAFLRGINVGGHVATKERLQKAFRSLGYLEVSTYRQSGNVIFQGNNEASADVIAKIEGCLKATLDYEVPVFLRTKLQLKALLQSDPFRGQSIDGASFLVTFLARELLAFPLALPYIIPKSRANIIGASKTEVFSVTHGGGEGALPNPFLEKTLNMKATTRNMNVLREITKKFC